MRIHTTNLSSRRSAFRSRHTVVISSQKPINTVCCADQLVPGHFFTRQFIVLTLLLQFSETSASTSLSLPTPQTRASNASRGKGHSASHQRRDEQQHARH